MSKRFACGLAMSRKINFSTLVFQRTKLQISIKNHISLTGLAQIYVRNHSLLTNSIASERANAIAFGIDSVFRL